MPLWAIVLVAFLAAVFLALVLPNLPRVSRALYGRVFRAEAAAEPGDITGIALGYATVGIQVWGGQAAAAAPTIPPSLPLLKVGV
jgi:hypothetical protein